MSYKGVLKSRHNGKISNDVPLTNSKVYKSSVTDDLSHSENINVYFTIS